MEPLLIAHSNKHSTHMDWGVVADANQEVWLGDGLKVARGGLLACRCEFFCFVLVGSNVSIPFC